MFKNFGNNYIHSRPDSRRSGSERRPAEPGRYIRRTPAPGNRPGPGSRSARDSHPGRDIRSAADWRSAGGMRSAADNR